MPALEGGDALEGDLEKLYEMHENGLRLIQLIHFRNNELGHAQTSPYSPGGLSEFGREVVREANRLGLVIDTAHANNETLMDVIALSRHPIIFSHGGVREYTDHDRVVTDDQIRAIAENGGVVGIWPNDFDRIGHLINRIQRCLDKYFRSSGPRGRLGQPAQLTPQS